MSGFLGFLTGPDKEDRDEIKRKSAAGKVQPASDFSTAAKREAMMQVIAEDNRNKTGGADAFAAAEAEARRRAYVGSAIDKSTQSGSASKQTGTPSTHTGGNF